MLSSTVCTDTLQPRHLTFFLDFPEKYLEETKKIKDGADATLKMCL